MVNSRATSVRLAMPGAEVVSERSIIDRSMALRAAGGSILYGREIK